MNKTLLTLITISLFFISLTGCGNNNSDATNKSTNQSAEASPKEEGQLDNDLLGRYHGIQPSYFLKNQYGDDMVINGNKVSVPSIDFKFLLKENKVVSLQQINLEDNSRVYYEGNYKIIMANSDSIQIECALSDGESSKPIYHLSISKHDKKGICTGSNEPEFAIEKN